jgi:2-C-methyl-D-erythritol 4-phosphate cytidylyltransferase
MEKAENNTFALILAAAGRSSRFSNRTNADPTVKKTFVHLGGKPIWLRSAEKFISREDVVQVIVVISPEDISWFRQYYAAEINEMLLLIVSGGENRVDSIRNGLAAVSPKVGYVAIHDAARPCVTEQEINAVFREAKKTGAALLAAPVVGTVKKVVDGRVETTVPRDDLWEAQTPQVFRRDWIIEAYKQKTAKIPTDDAQLVEQIGKPVSVVPGDRRNLKITTPSDLIVAKYMIEQK